MKETCCVCERDVDIGVWVEEEDRFWTFYCPDCYEEEAQLSVLSWRYAKKRYLTKDNNTEDKWNFCLRCHGFSHDSILTYDNAMEAICPECGEAGSMVKL